MADKPSHFPYLSHDEFSKLSQTEKIVYLKIAVFELSRELGPREIFKPIIAHPPDSQSSPDATPDPNTNSSQQ